MTLQSDKRTSCGVGSMFMREREGLGETPRRDEFGQTPRTLMHQPMLSSRVQELMNGISNLGDRMQALEEKVSQGMRGNAMPTPRTVHEHEEMKIAARALGRCQDLPDVLRAATEAMTTQTRQTDVILQRILQAQLQLMTFMERVHRDSSMQMDTYRQSLEDMKNGLTTLLDTTSRSEQKAEQIAAQFKELELPVSGRPANIVPVLQLPVVPEDPAAQLKQGFEQSARTSRESETARDTESAVETERKSLVSSPDKIGRMPAQVEPVPEDEPVVQVQSPKDQCDQKDTAGVVRDKVLGSEAKVFEKTDWLVNVLVQHLNPPDTFLGTIVHSNYFVMATCLGIVLNTLLLGIQVEIELNILLWTSQTKEDYNAKTGWFTWVNILFLVLFSLELFIRIFAERCYFFIGKQRIMNLFDLMLTGVCALEEIIYLALQSRAFLGNVSFIRAIRILRLFQTLRVLRLFRYSGSLRLMVGQIMSSFQSLSWAFFLIFILVYCCSCFVCQSVVNWCQSDDFSRESDVYHYMQALFGTVPRTMYTLIRAVSGGMDWSDMVGPWMGISSSVVIVLVFYVLFVVFGMLNVLTGVFCDKAREASEMDRDLVVEAEKENMRHYALALQNEFLAMDSNHSGTVSLSQFRVYTQSEDVQAYLAHMGISVDDSLQLFCMMPKDQNGEVDMEHFIRGVLRMRGAATSIEMMKIESEIHHLQSMLKTICQALSVKVSRKSGLTVDDLTNV